MNELKKYFYASVSRNRKGKKVSVYSNPQDKMTRDEANTKCRRTGNGLMVVDIDTKDMSSIDARLVELLPDVATVETYNGYHWYFTGGNSIGQTQGILPKVDIRNEGGHVYCKHWGDDKTIQYDKTGETYEISDELLQYLTKKQSVKNSRLLELCEGIEARGEPWANFGDGAHHESTRMMMQVMRTAGHSESEIWAKSLEYMTNYLLQSSDEVSKFKSRLQWVMDTIVPKGDSLKGEILEDNYQAKEVESVKKPESYPDTLETKNGTKILSTSDNLAHLMSNVLEYDYNYDVIKKDMNLYISGLKRSHDQFAIHAYDKVKSEAVKAGLSTSIMDFYDGVISKVEINPLVTMCTKIEWDGIDRLQSFYDLFETREDKYYYEEGLKRFLVQCVAAWDHAKSTPLYHAKPTFETIWVLQSEQGIKKTKTLASLLPKELSAYFGSGIVLDIKNKDLVKQAVSFGLVELGELDATFKKADIADLKAFMSKEYDEMRMPYAKATSRYARRTSFIATVNNDKFLNDVTGNRRFFTTRILNIGNIDLINTQQVWAQIWKLYIDGCKWWFDEGESWTQLRDEVNEESRESGLVGDIIAEVLTRIEEEVIAEKATASRIWESYTGRLPNYQERTAFSAELQKISKRNAANYFHVPLGEKG